MPQILKIHTVDLFYSPEIKALSKASRTSSQSRENTSPQLPNEGQELGMASLVPWARALEGNSQGIRMVGGKAGQGRMMEVLGATLTTTGANLEGASTNSGLASLTLFKVDEELFLFLFFF